MNRKTILSYLIIAAVMFTVIMPSVFLVETSIKEKHSFLNLFFSAKKQNNLAALRASDDMMYSSPVGEFARVYSPGYEKCDSLLKSKVSEFNYSIVNYLRYKNTQSGISNRSKIAEEFNMKGYVGSSKQNISLIKALILSNGEINSEECKGINIITDFINS